MKDCEYCKKFVATYLITRIMQPSPPHYACERCKKKDGYMVIKKLNPYKDL